VILYYLGHHFYELRPNYVVHNMWDLRFNAADIRWEHLRFLDEVSPFHWGSGAIVFLLLVLLVAILGKAGQWRSAISLLVGMVLIVFSIGVNKVHDGIPSVFYPWARMFLAIPFLLALFTAEVKVRPSRWASWLMPLFAAGFFFYKCVGQAAAVDRQFASGKQTDVLVERVDDLKRHCAEIDHIAHIEQAHLVVVGWAPGKHLTNYGCPCLVNDFPTTLEPLLDRRTWWIKAHADQVLPNVLFAEFWGNPFVGKHAVEVVSQDPTLYLLQGNTLRTDSLLVHLGVGLRPY
jgi:hypothetical protein